MAVKISGVLKDGTGKPVQNCTIQLKAKRNSTTVVVNTVASENPDEAGRYSMDVEYGQYSVILLVEGFPPSHAGTITVYEDSQPGTLNDFLGAMTEDDARPEALRRFELMVEEVARNASVVAQNTAAAKKSASDASTSAREAATHATDAADSARAARTSAGQAATSAQEAFSSAGTASAKATEASKSAAAAESSKSAAATSAGAAKTSETNAAASATAAGKSAESAASSASTATTKADEATEQATAAARSASAAKTSETNAKASETSAESSKTAAASSAGRAASSAQSASSSAGMALIKASKASESAAAAESSKSAAAGSATAAAQSKSTAESAATRAETAAKRAEDIASAVGLEDASTTKKGIVQLSSATNSTSETLAATPKAVKIVMDETKTKAPLDSPAFTGTPTTPTPPDDAVGLEMANAAFVRKLLAALVGSSPEALDTLNELAAALGNDPNFATTVTNALAGKQPLSDILTAISKLTVRADNLLYFNTGGNIALSPLSAKARSLLAQFTSEDMRQVLEISDSVALQSNIYDRTEGRGALPGALGFGALTSAIKYFSASDGQSELVTWCMQTPPGRYLVEQRTHPDFNPIIPDIGFTGVLEIKISYRVYSQAEHQSKRKLLTFYGQYGDVYRTVLDANPANPSLRPWSSGYINRSGIASLLGSDSRAPEVGNIILAAYYGTSDSDMTRTLQRGKIYPGSRLGHVEFSGGVATGAGVKGITPTCYVSGRSYSLSLPGAYRALSGSGGVLMADNNTIVGLFVRVR